MDAKPQIIAYTALGCAVMVWASWFPLTRVALTDGLSVVEIALLRFAPASLVFLFLAKGIIAKLRAAPRWTAIALIGWGAPFVLALATGLRDASVAEAAALVPCLVPLFTLLGERVLSGRELDRAQQIGFVLIAACAAIVFSRALGVGGLDLASFSVLMISALGWAAFTLALPRSGLGALEATAYISMVSLAALLALLALQGDPFGGVPAARLVLHGVVQGVLAGLLAILAYGNAIAKIGNQRASAFTVLVPGLAAFLAWLMLSETPAWPIVIALLCGTIGVGLVHGIHRLRAKRHSI